MNQGSLLRTHTHIEDGCFDPSKVETCTENGKTCWIAENLGTSTQQLRAECPKGEKWLCIENKLGGGIIENGQYYQDLVREQAALRTGLPTTPQTSMEGLTLPEIGKNLFVDLGEISKELNITDCWVCGGALMTETWPWRGIAWARSNS